jgi:hypothetical protein
MIKNVIFLVFQLLCFTNKIENIYQSEDKNQKLKNNNDDLKKKLLFFNFLLIENCDLEILN